LAAGFLLGRRGAEAFSSRGLGIAPDTPPLRTLHRFDIRFGDHATGGDAMTIKLAALADRRADNRLATPLCLHCADGHVMVGIIRSTRFVYFRCPRCGDLQPKLMPAIALGHGLVAQLLE
jgi:hypothetical protein